MVPLKARLETKCHLLIYGPKLHKRRSTETNSKHPKERTVLCYNNKRIPKRGHSTSFKYSGILPSIAVEVRTSHLHLWQQQQFLHSITPILSYNHLQEIITSTRHTFYVFIAKYSPVAFIPFKELFGEIFQLCKAVDRSVDLWLPTQALHIRILLYRCITKSKFLW